MDSLIELDEKPEAQEIYMIAGWQQWADAGSISSGLPEYLIKKTQARKIGQIKPDGFYLFQVPGTHHLLRPHIKLQEGYRLALKANRNEFFYAENNGKGLLIFLGIEPHMNVERYADAFLDVAQACAVQRTVTLGGVYGAVPFDKAREIACAYSLPRLKAELEQYALRFSNYEGGATIGTYLVDRAGLRDIELVALYGFVPSYDFSQTVVPIQSIRIENDYKAWHDLLTRLAYMFGLKLDLTELERQSARLIHSVEEKIRELDVQTPDIEIARHLQEALADFEERSFVPLDDVWERGLRDLFGDQDDN